MRVCHLLAGSVLGLLGSFALAEPPQVLASIKPLQLIAAAITEGVSQPAVLLPPGANPHSYQLRPSERRTLHEADLILWVGPALEPYLAKLLLEHRAPVAAMTLPGLTLSHLDEPEAPLHTHNETDTEADAHHPDHDAHQHQGDDPHIWLYPENARAIATALTTRLQQLDPANAAQYAGNLEQFSQSLDTLLVEVPQRFTNLDQQGFYVFHDAWGYLARAFALQVRGHITLSPEQQPGIRHLNSLRQTFKAEAPLCLLVEPGFKPAYLDRILEDLPVSRGTIDPLASTIEISAHGYRDYLIGTLETIDRCLSETSASRQ